MALPGFTADASVGPTVEVYRVQHQFGTPGMNSLGPQQFDVGEDAADAGVEDDNGSGMDDLAAGDMEDGTAEEDEDASAGEEM